MKPCSSFAAAVTLALAALAATAANGSPHILPSGASVPENLLRIELALDAPLAAPLDMARVVLRDATGQPIEAPFLDLPLVSPDGKRITILMHPGRVKTGVGPNTAVGLALQQGQQVSLTISDPQLARVLVKSWRVEPARRVAVDPQSWHLNMPRPGSRQPLLVRFPAALSAHAAGLIAVSARGQRLAGSAALSGGEMLWRFTPDTAWKPGAYELHVHASLEDPQGNRLCSAFEQPRQSAIPCTEDARIPFTVAAYTRHAAAKDTPP